MPYTLDRKEQLERLRERYARRNKQGRTRMLDELCEQYGYDRKHAIKLLGDSLPPCKGSAPPGPPPRYDAVREVLEIIWEHAEQLCGKRLAPALALWLPHYGKHPLHNFFLPSTKLIEKTRDGGRIIRKHDAPQTAHQRLLQSGELKGKARKKLRDEYEGLDPFALAKELNPRLKKILN